MQPEIRTVGEINLVGMRRRMSFAKNATSELWRGFMPRRNEIVSAEAKRLFSVQIFDRLPYSSDFDTETEFEKWAAVEVESFLPNIPEGMEKLTLAGGLYAVFEYKGTVEQFAPVARYIYSEWLPASGYELDNRPHFDILGEKYLGPMNPESEEEIWIPVRQ